MGLSETIVQRVTQLLSASAGTLVRIVQSEPVAEGWSASFGMWPWVTRCTLRAETGVVPGSVIVKVRRPAEHLRSAKELFYCEQAALEFLAVIGSTAGPRLLAVDSEMGLFVLEDLGTDPALEDLLVGNNAAAASQGLIAFAAALGQMHAATTGHAEEYYRMRGAYGPVDPIFDRVSVLGYEIQRSWRQLQEIVASRPSLPSPGTAVGRDVDEICRVLSEPGPYLALSNGDTSPANCRISSQGLRFLDFEHACFRHALLDVASLRLPFPGCPCWSHLPAEVDLRTEEAYRQQAALFNPAALDSARYAHELAVACAAWTILRMVRLPKLERVDEPQPMGFSRRGQLLDTIATTVSCSQQSCSLLALASWLASINAALRACWPHLAPVQPLYPAFS
jgi:hypothetical protein